MQELAKKQLSCTAAPVVSRPLKRKIGYVVEKEEKAVKKDEAEEREQKRSKESDNGVILSFRVSGSRSRTKMSID